MSVINVANPNRVIVPVRSVRNFHSSGQERMPFYPAKSANFRIQFQGYTRALKTRLNSSSSKIPRRSVLVRAEKVVGIDLGTTNSAVSFLLLFSPLDCFAVNSMRASWCIYIYILLLLFVSQTELSKFRLLRWKVVHLLLLRMLKAEELLRP
jgi:hypothetical protein